MIDIHPASGAPLQAPIKTVVPLQVAVDTVEFTHDVDVDLQDQDVASPLKTIAVTTKETIAFRIAAAFLAIFVFVLVIGLLRGPNLAMLDYIKGVCSAFAQGLSMILCYYFVTASHASQSQRK